MHALVRRLTIAGALIALPLTTTHAQGVFGAAEFGDDDVSFFLLGGAWSPGGLGWQPFVSVVGYNLRFDAGPTTETRNVVLPTVGLMNMQQMQSYQFGVGYAFSDEDVGAPFLVQAESGDGVVGSFGWDYWGDGTKAIQLLGSYNFGTEFLWTRGRAGIPVRTGSPLWIGGEAALLGGGDPSAYIAQLGPTLEYRFSPQFRLGGSAGWKVGVSNASGSAMYGRVEFLWLPRAK